MMMRTPTTTALRPPLHAAGCCDDTTTRHCPCLLVTRSNPFPLLPRRRALYGRNLPRDQQSINNVSPQQFLP